MQEGTLRLCAEDVSPPCALCSEQVLSWVPPSCRAELPGEDTGTRARPGSCLAGLQGRTTKPEWLWGDWAAPGLQAGMQDC